MDFNLYNTNTRLVTVARIVVEFTMSNYVSNWFHFYTFSISLYDAYIDQFRLIGEVVYVFMWVYYLQKEIRRLLVTSPK